MKRLVFALALLSLAAGCGTRSGTEGTGGGGGTSGDGGGSGGTGGGSGGTGGGTGGGSAMGGGSGGTGGGSTSTGGGSGGTGGGNGSAVTWYKDVLPITQVRCQGCHTAGGIAPFSMDTYLEAAPHASAMAYDVNIKKMPPWMPSASCQSFKDARVLTAAEIKTINDWSSGGAIAGNPADAPAPVSQPGLPRVDQTLDTGFDYTPAPPPGEPDDYHCFVVDPQLTANKYVIGLDVSPAVRKMVHHVILYTAAASDAAAKNTGGTGWTCFGGPGTPSPTMIGGWVPGTPPTVYPTGTGVLLAAGRVIVAQIHYNTANVAGQNPLPKDKTTIKLMYATGSVTAANILPMADQGFSIPPNAMGYTHSKTFPSGGTLYGVLPHMHTKGRSIKVEVNGACMIDIPKWDFHWQQFYFYPTPIKLTPSANGAVVTCTWDNPTNATVTWGEGTADEMCLNYAYLTAP